MATIGEILSQPEIGWKRYDDRHPDIIYEGNNWSLSAPTGFYETTFAFSNSSDAKISFLFVGTKIRIISTIQQSYSEDVRIKIDGIEESYNTYHATLNNPQSLVYEKTGLENKAHIVEIYRGSGEKRIGLDAIDIDDSGSIRLPINSMILKNKITNQAYSLSDSTLIHLPDSSDKNMILHGIEQGKEIQLDVDFDKIQLIQDTSEVLGSGKLYSHSLSVKDTKKIIFN